jgi:hypothetical protein
MAARYSTQPTHRLFLSLIKPATQTIMKTLYVRFEPVFGQLAPSVLPDNADCPWNRRNGQRVQVERSMWRELELCKARTAFEIGSFLVLKPHVLVLPTGPEKLRHLGLIKSSEVQMELLNPFTMLQSSPPDLLGCV